MRLKGICFFCLKFESRDFSRNSLFFNVFAYTILFQFPVGYVWASSGMKNLPIDPIFSSWVHLNKNAPI